MKTLRVENRGRPLSAPMHVIYCDSFLCRLCGLMFRSHLAPSEGLLLVQGRDSRLDSAIHMLFVFMDLAVVWLDSDHTVVDTVLARAWRPVYIPRRKARFILETAPERLAEFHDGDVLEFTDA